MIANKDRLLNSVFEFRNQFDQTEILICSFQNKILCANIILHSFLKLHLYLHSPVNNTHIHLQKSLHLTILILNILLKHSISLLPFHTTNNRFNSSSIFHILSNLRLINLSYHHHFHSHLRSILKTFNNNFNNLLLLLIHHLLLI